MVALITFLHVVVCLFIIIVVLLQHGKSADIAATFGGMGSQTAFGPRGTATLLSKLTTWSAVIFMLTSITLSIFLSRRSGTSSVLQDRPAGTTQTAPQKNAPQTPNQQGPAPEPQPMTPNR